MVQLSDLWLLLALAVIVMIWWHSLGLKTRALNLAKQRCKQLDLQLIDESVVLRKMRLTRNTRGVLAVQRVFRFEFSTTGDRRYNGALSLLGAQLQGFEFEAYKETEFSDEEADQRTLH